MPSHSVHTRRSWVGVGLLGHTVVSMCPEPGTTQVHNINYTKERVEESGPSGVDCNFPDYQIWTQMDSKSRTR